MCLALMGPGDTAIVPAPSFPIHVYAVMLASGNVIALDVRKPESFLRNVAYTCEHLYPEAESGRRQLSAQPEHHGRRARVLRRPGRLGEEVRLPGHQRFRLRATSASTATRPRAFWRLPGAIDVGVEFTTMSKGYSMAGWRIGFCSGNAEMVRALATIKGYYDYGIFQPIQIAAIVAMRHCDAAVESIAAEYQQRRDVLCDGLERVGWEIDVPKAGMFVWAKIPEPWAQMGSIDFSMMLLDKGGVAVSPGRGFGEEGEGYLRLAIVENSQRLRQAAKQIQRCLKTEPGAGGQIRTGPKSKVEHAGTP